MARTDLETLVFSLEASTAKFNRAIDKMNRDFGRQMGQTEKRAKQMQTSLNATFARINGGVAGHGKGLLAGLVGSIGASASIAGIEKAVARLAEIGNLAQQVGLTTDELQQIGYAASQAGGSVEEAEKAIARFAKEVGTRGSEVQQIFAQAGVAITDAKGNLLPMITLFERYLDVIKSAGNAQAQLAISAKGFGREGGTAMVMLGQGGSEAFRQLASDAERAGNVIDRNVIARSVALDDSLTRLKQNIAGIGSALLAEFGGPALESAMQGLLSFFRETRHYIELIKGISTPNAAGNYDLRPFLNSFVKGTPENLAKRAAVFGPPPGPGVNTTITKPPAPVRSIGAAGVDTTGAKTESAYEREVASINDKIDALNTEAATLGMTAGAAAEYQARQELIAAATEKGKTLTDAQTVAIDELARRYGALVTSVERARSQIEAINEAQKAFATEASGAFEKLIVDGENLRDVLADVLRNLARMLIQASLAGTGPLAGLLGTASTTGGAGGLFGALFGGFRAGGGDIRPGRAYVVGEKGPEIVVPKMAGRVIPNERMRATPGGGGQAVNVTINAPIDAPGADPAQLMRVANELAALKADIPRQIRAGIGTVQQRRVRV